MFSPSFTFASLTLVQSYGIKVGYGAGTSGGVNLNQSNAAPAKGGCCG
jgi:hypothetical protein